jgi:hypothetical protein
MLAVCVGSSVDQHSNNATLFNLVEQVTVPPNTPPPPGGLIPLEIHAYFAFRPEELRQSFDVRFALVARTGLETYSDVFEHVSQTPRYRTRTMGIPLPPIADQYELRVDIRSSGVEAWRREPVAWPFAIVEAGPPPSTVTH